MGVGYADNDRQVVLKFIETTDVHGNFLSYDFINDRAYHGGLSKVESYVRRQRNLWGEDHCILLDCGDILEGQPCAYYANFIAKNEVHLAADIMNFMEYDVATFGNHDFEVGHEVYDKWVHDCRFPVLGANILRTDNHQPYAKPYTIIEKDGIRIAVLGLITPAIPMWLPEQLWSGIYFDDIVESARKWVQFIRQDEHPDLVVGLFHTGLKEEGLNGFNENAAEEIASQVPGFDLIFFGHDHQACAVEVTNQIDGKTIWALNAGGATTQVAEAVVTCIVNDDGVHIEQVSGQLVSIKEYPTDLAFSQRYANYKSQVKAFVSQKIGELKTPIRTIDYFFGPSPLGTLLHTVQFKHVNVDISLSAPLTYNEVIHAGDIHIKDIFKLYRYENLIEVFRLTGKEVRGALERSYDLLTNTEREGSSGKVLCINMSRNRHYIGAFSPFLITGAGIQYEVDLTKPMGEKVSILTDANGQPFDYDKTYLVAVNSYIGSGGGGILTDGAGLNMQELSKRIVTISQTDIRSCIINYFTSSTSPVEISTVDNWKYVFDEATLQSFEEDKKLLLGRKKHTKH